MNNKKIKILGIFLAIFLILIIIMFSFFAISSVFTIFIDKNIQDAETTIIEDEIKSFDIDLKSSELIIEIGDENSLETNNSNIETKVENGMLYITEKKKAFYNSKHLYVLLTIKDDIYDSVEINSGIGTFLIDYLKVNNFKLNSGVGSGTINNIEVYNNTKIDTGIGMIEILDGNIHNLDLSTGIGKFTLISTIEGNSKIDSGIGELNINLKDSQDNYKINLDKQRGIYINDKKVNEKNIGTGINTIDINKGLGHININFDYNENEINLINQESSIKILEYFQNNDKDFIIVGELIEGYFEDGMEVKLMHDEEELGNAIIIDETMRYGNNTIDNSLVSDKVYIKIQSINEEQLKLINYIKK